MKNSKLIIYEKHERMVKLQNCNRDTTNEQNNQIDHLSIIMNISDTLNFLMSNLLREIKVQLLKIDPACSAFNLIKIVFLKLKVIHEKSTNNSVYMINCRSCSKTVILLTCSSH